MEHNWKPVIEKLKTSRKVLLTTHVNPDGDGLSSEIAMYYCLRKMDIEVEIINDSALPDEYSFLDPENIIRQYDREKDRGRLNQFDLIFTLDIGGVARLGKLGEDLALLNISTICIDHHPENHISCSYKIVDEKSPATACLIYELMKQMNPEVIDTKIAEALYVGLMTDTGSFRFENTTAKAMEIAAELIRLGAKPADIFSNVYENYTRQRMKLLGVVLQKIQYEFEGKLAWFKVLGSDIQEAGATLDEVGGFTDFVRSIKGVEVSIMFLEVRKNRVRVNFRSQGKVIVNEIARKFGGGGHFFAAGISLNDTLEDAVDKVLPEVRNAVRKLSL
ncbi:MAG: bifunctional oligoribonuclease/PAP phosphatase NrnA [Candidatus Marinimicrobia bacterium]|nr:bifunctional oligoribonuclease/PAP phosphatase NrnA [Candidatus Neomarinimicrobiota bacterium]